jgi:hypothetical protein
MSAPLVQSFKIQSPGLLDSLIPMFIVLTSVKLLCTQGSSGQMDDQIVPLVGHIIHRPKLVLQNCLFVLLGAIGEVIANSSVANQNHILVLQLSQLGKIPLQIHLLLTDQSGDRLVGFIGEVGGNDICT